MTEITPAIIQVERERQIAKGYTSEHDDAHGIYHLHYWAERYATDGKYVEALALLTAAREARDRAGLFAYMERLGGNQ